MQLPTEEVADGRKAADGFGGADLPFSVKIVLRILRADLGNRDVPNLRIVGGEFLQLWVFGAVDAPLHVGLSGANPDFADQNVLELKAVFSFDFERVRASGRERIQVNFPSTIRFGAGGVALAGNAHGDHFAFVRPAPDGVSLRSLQHHSVADDGGDFDLCLPSGNGNEGAEGKKRNCAWRAATGSMYPVRFHRVFRGVIVIGFFRFIRALWGVGGFLSSKLLSGMNFSSLYFVEKSTA